MQSEAALPTDCRDHDAIPAALNHTAGDGGDLDAPQDLLEVTENKLGHHHRFAPTGFAFRYPVP